LNGLCNNITVSGYTCHHFIGLGSTNNICGSNILYATIINGTANTASGTHALVGGGNSNTASAYYSSIVGGICNISCGLYSFVGNGTNNVAGNCNSSVVINGFCNTASGSYSTVINGQNTTASNTHSFARGNFVTASGIYSTASGYCSTASGTSSTVSGGTGNLASGAYTTIGGGLLNSASVCGSSIVGGCSNTISGYSVFAFIGSGTQNTISCYSDHATLSGGYINNICNAGASVIGGGYCNNIYACGGTSVIGGGCGNVACGQFSAISGGFQAKTYLYGQQANSSGQFSAVGDAQSSYMVARKVATLNASGTSIMSLDGTGVTGLIIPDGNNRSWNVTVEWVIVCTVLGTGTSGSLAVGGTHTGTDTFYFIRVGGTSSISAITNVSSHNTAGMASSDVTITVGASQELQLTLVAPSTAGTGSTFRAVANVRVVEVAW
jgi:hypothetical protein